jgi:hypothetical protein
MNPRPLAAQYLEISFTALVVVIAAGVSLMAAGWPIQARLFPTVVALPLLALALVQLGVAIRSRAGVEGSPAEADDLGLWNQAARRLSLRLASWIVAFVVCVMLFSFPLGLSIGLFLYLRLESRERWRICFLLAGITFGYMYFVFGKGLHLPWPEGLVTQFFLG